MLNKEKKDRFCAIARELYTKEHLGTDEYGTDTKYEEELTSAAAEYLFSIFNAPSKTEGAKNKLVAVMNRREIKHPSNILKIILHSLPNP